jgi:hypothetical protein
MFYKVVAESWATWGTSIKVASLTAIGRANLNLSLSPLDTFLVLENWRFQELVETKSSLSHAELGV